MASTMARQIGLDNGLLILQRFLTTLNRIGNVGNEVRFTLCVAH